jgi:hypothetical protein
LIIQNQLKLNQLKTQDWLWAQVVSLIINKPRTKSKLHLTKKPPAHPPSMLKGGGLKNAPYGQIYRCKKFNFKYVLDKLFEFAIFVFYDVQNFR